MKDKAKSKNRSLYYLVLAVSVLVLTATTVLAVYFLASDTTTLEVPPAVETPVEPNEPSKPSGGEEVVSFVNPMQEITVKSGYGFHHNQTLGWYFEHEGVDITASVGDSVCAMSDGVVLSVTTDELTGTEIVISHADGVQTCYRFVTAEKGLEVGDVVEMGEKIATVADPTGAEYKEGAHLHLEVRLNGIPVDPTEYLTLNEK